MTEDLRSYCTQISGNRPGEVALTGGEAAAAKKVPVNIESIDKYFENRAKARFSHHLRGLMRDEVYNFVDGKRSCYDIYKAVWAESMAAGEWYYGAVTMEDVVGLLDAAVDAQAMTWKR